MSPVSFMRRRKFECWLRLLLPSCLVMFSLATTQVMLSLTQLIQGFTGHPSDEILGGAQIYFGAQNKFRNAQYFIYATSVSQYR